MDAGERTTGTRDEQYNLVSVLYHALHAAENCDVYAVDAEAAGDTDLANFFRDAQATQRQLAERAKERLGLSRGIAVLGTAETGTEVPPEGIVGPEAPPTPRDVRRGTVPESPPSRRTTGIEEEGLPRREEAPPRRGESAPLGREGTGRPEREREEEKGLLDRARDAFLGKEEESRRREGTDRPDRR